MAFDSDKKAMHESHCNVCKSNDRLEIEDKYLRHISPYQIAIEHPGISKDSIYRHVWFFELDKKKTDDLDGILDAVINRGMECLPKIEVNAGQVTKAVENKAKLAGKFIEKRETKHTGEIKHDVSDRVNEQMTNLISKIGGLPSEISPEDIQEPVSE